MQQQAVWPKSVVWLHAVTGTLILGVGAWGYYLVSPPSWDAIYIDRYMAGVPWHKLGGIAAIPLLALWVVIRSKKPRGPRTGPLWQQRCSRFVHLALFFCASAAPLSGYGMDSTVNAELQLPLGWTIPSPFPLHQSVSIALTYVHKWAAYSLLGLCFLHILAAIWHGISGNGAVLRRMLPFYKNETST